MFEEVYDMKPPRLEQQVWSAVFKLEVILFLASEFIIVFFFICFSIYYYYFHSWKQSRSYHDIHFYDFDSTQIFPGARNAGPFEKVPQRVPNEGACCIVAPSSRIID